MLNFYFLVKLKEIIDVSYFGSISFYDYMNFCLYSKWCGFYNNTVKMFDKNRTYDTLPNISRMFSFILAIRLDLFLRMKVDFGILEIGPGSGQFSVDILYFLVKFGTPFSRYLLLECSSNLYNMQKNLFKIKKIFKKILWVKCIPYGFSGIIVANEILDAIPTFCVSFKSFTFYERRVSYSGLQFIWVLYEFSFFLKNILLKKNNFFFKKREFFFYFFEICVYYVYFIISLLRSVNIGIFYFFDYGFLNENYYRGTLRCVYQRLSYNSPFIIPSNQDITTYVDFLFLLDFCLKIKLKIYPLLFFYKFFFIVNLEFFSNSFDVYNKLYLLLYNEIRLCFFPERMGVLFKILFFIKNTSTKK